MEQDYNFYLRVLKDARHFPILCTALELQDIRRESGLSLFDAGEDNNKVQWSKVKKACEKCQNPEMHYTTRQVILSISLSL
ncbi:hypothetical protein Ddye_032799 [Dipteronia dyeriana]|uniref:Uncharacterized protein n=1 Tax=Dipteronia dyeriana TaxID=168575 RepID=A0AAD9TDB2_9ROSI|nr:hypothetical protein Ddye_032799 [Dipteronia dyeriana]